jgi:hypothetical protein
MTLFLKNKHGYMSDKITSGDVRYEDLNSKGFNKRYTGKPDYFCLVRSTAAVVAAVQEAVNSKRRLVVRSGGHCLEGFVRDPAVQVVIDMSLMAAVYFDTERTAFAVEAGATVGEMYRQLFLGWGVVVPAGEYPAIGMGGHVLGGAFGFLCREYGLAADYLYGVEVVVVDGAGQARSVVATCEPSDPHRTLWWAHTGGGGGNFGIVTRYWFRSPDAIGLEPASQLPKAPASVTTFRLSWDWKDFDEKTFSRLANNFGEFGRLHSGVDSPHRQLFSLLFLNHRSLGKLEVKGLSTAGDQAASLIEGHLAAITEGIGPSPVRQVEQLPWLSFALNPFPELFRPGFDDNVRAKVKDAYLRKPFTDSQVATAWRYLTTPEQGVMGGGLGLATYGGKVNTRASDATATAQRDAIFDIACNAGWGRLHEEAPTLQWVRSFYKDLFATAGGVPVPNEQTDGAMINHPDTDLADPEWNGSGIPWSTLYYKENYPRLQQVKASYDPLNIFHHALSVRP